MVFYLHCYTIHSPKIFALVKISGLPDIESVELDDTFGSIYIPENHHRRLENSDDILAGKAWFYNNQLLF